MKPIFTFICLFITMLCAAQPSLQNGDLLFVRASCGDLSSAITDATATDASSSFDHVAIYHAQSPEGVVYEAIPGCGVIVRSLPEFLAECGPDRVVAMRLAPRYQRGIDWASVMQRAQSLVGTPYDTLYLPGEARIYCSELVWLCYRNARGRHFFPTVPMRFRRPDGSMPDYWTRLYTNANLPVPEGEPGTNPNQLSQDKRLVRVPGDIFAPAPVLPVPTPQQVQWQKMERYAFAHFGLNTFTDAEWGYGDVSPQQFNPSRLDCRQWAQTLVNAGMEGIILTAKHHDGFCLWPSQYTDYSVKASPWREGQGDVLRELSEACRTYGLRLGLYNSPWDRNRADYGAPTYVAYYYNQWRELLSNYGDLFEVWVDGANGGDGWYGGTNEKRQIDKRNYYQFNKLAQMVDSLQEGRTLIFSDGGPGCRWVGNENGEAGQTNWSLLRGKEVYPGYERYPELTSGHADGDCWIPAECDVSIRPGWFYHEREDTMVKSPADLVELYFRSVGRNGNLLINFPVNREGRISATDSANAVALHHYLQRNFAHDALRGIVPVVSNTRGAGHWKFAGSHLTNDNYDSYWATDDSVTTAVIEFALPGVQELNCLLLQEYIPLGQRVQRFRIEVLQNGVWEAVRTDDELTTIGYKRLVRFDNVTTDALRVVVERARGPLCLSRLAAFHLSEE